MVFDLPVRDVLSIFTRHRKAMLEATHQVTNPRAVMIAAQPGAGKSSVTPKLMSTFGPEGAVSIDIDAIRLWDPKCADLYRDNPFSMARMTVTESYYWASRLIASAVWHRRNIVLENPMSFGARPMSVAFKALRLLGYTTELHAIAVPWRQSVLSVFKRFEDSWPWPQRGHWVALGKHDRCFKASAHTVGWFAKSGAFASDAITIYRRDGTVLERGSDGAEAAMRAEQQKKWSARELKEYADAWTDLAAQVDQRRGLKPDWYMSAIDNLRREAVREAGRPPNMTDFSQGPAYRSKWTIGWWRTGRIPPRTLQNVA